MKYGSLLYHVAVWQQQNAKVILFMPTRLGKRELSRLVYNVGSLVIGYCDFSAYRIL